MRTAAARWSGCFGNTACRAIRSDNGPPFASVGVTGLSRLAVWWLKLGIMPERIEPGRSEQNGRHERMHKTLKAECASPPQANRGAQQSRFDQLLRSVPPGVQPSETA